MTTRTRLWQLAARQHWLLTTAQLLAAGLTPAAIEHRVRTGRLFVVRRGVFAVGRPPGGPEQRVMAAVLAVGPAAVLSHRSAAWLWGVVERDRGPVDVALPSQSGRNHRPGVRVHRCATLRPEQLTRRRLIPVTSLPRTLRDLAGVLTAQDLRSAVRQAERLHRVDLPQLRMLVAAPPTAHREARLRRLLDAYVPATLNPGLEEACFEALVRAGVRLPATQHRVGRDVPDFLWEPERLVVETDDRASHGTWTARADDLARDRRLRAQGFAVLRFTWADVSNDPAAVAEEIRAALAQRRVELGLEPPPAHPLSGGRGDFAS